MVEEERANAVFSPAFSCVRVCMVERARKRERGRKREGKRENVCVRESKCRLRVGRQTCLWPRRDSTHNRAREKVYE